MSIHVAEPALTGSEDSAPQPGEDLKLGPGIVSETEVARIERDDFAVPETVGLTLDKGKRLAAAAQAEIVRAQLADG